MNLANTTSMWVLFHSVYPLFLIFSQSKQLTMGASREDKEKYFEKLKELLAKYRESLISLPKQPLRHI